MSGSIASAPAGGQRGVALVVVLVLLLVVTLLGLAAMRGSLMQERMAGNVIARGEAFQVAEAVLREAEAFAASKPSAPEAGCAAGVCAMPEGGATPAWQADGFWESAGGFRLSNLEIDGLAARYVVEDWGEAPSDACGTPIDMSALQCSGTKQVYRVTVRSRAPNGAEVLLQSMYEVP